MGMTTEKFEEYLQEIGGLENGFFPDREPIVSRYFCGVDDGWLQIIHDCITELIACDWDKQTTQIKEKLGGLRFYVNTGVTEIREIIRKYEKLSYEICEVCGEKGELREDCGWNGSRWYKTMCDKHYQELKAERSINNLILGDDTTI